jgi:maleylacetoacetate isomerase
MHPTVFYDYFRSSASYRVRIALNLAGIKYETVSVNLLEQDHKAPDHLERNPQGLVPVLDIDGHRLTQSLAILEYLSSTRDLGLLPSNPIQRAKVQALANCLAVDVHPVCNMSVVRYAADIAGGQDGKVEGWMGHFIRPGLLAFEAMLSSFSQRPFCTGNTPSLADVCLIPQLYNAERWGVEYADCKRIQTSAEACAENPAFQAALPEVVAP